MRNWLSVGVVLLACSAVWGADPLLGKWNLKFSPEEGGKEFEDVLVFTHVTVHAEGLRKQGFEPAAYEEDTRRHGPAKFTASQSSEKAGKLAWEGTAVNQEMTGRLRWTGADGKVVVYTFKGTKGQ